MTTKKMAFLTHSGAAALNEHTLGIQRFHIVNNDKPENSLEYITEYCLLFGQWQVMSRR